MANCIKTPVGTYYCSLPKQRVQALLDKCYLPENKYCLEHLPKWFADSEEWAKKRANDEAEVKQQRVRYTLNHLCPNLAHKFNPRPFDKGEDYSAIWRAHNLENTQASFYNDCGELLQDGIRYTTKEFRAIENFVKDIGTTYGKKRRYRVLRDVAEHDPYLSDMMHCIGLDYEMPYIHNEKIFYKPYRNHFDAPPKDHVWETLMDKGWARGKVFEDGSLHCHLTFAGLKVLEEKLDITIKEA